MACPSLQRLPERPFRTVPGGILRKFLRRLSQFPLSFPGTVSMGTPFLQRIALRAMPPLRRKSVAAKKRRGQAACKPVPLTLRLFTALLRNVASKVIDVCWEENVAVSFLVSSTYGDFKTRLRHLPPR